jgi:predicted double-glycine peptidase
MYNFLQKTLKSKLPSDNMKELKEIFLKYRKSLGKEKAKDYENGSWNEERRYKMLGIRGVFECLEKKEINSKNLMSISNLELIPYFRTQIHQNSCGSSCLRDLIMLNYGLLIYEKKLWEINNQILDKKGGIGQGFMHVDMARVVNYFAEKENKPERMFLTQEGTLENIEELLRDKRYPIINRPWTEDDSGGSHYEIVLSYDKENIILFNPANQVETTGIYKIEKEKFEEFWKINEERRFLVMLEPGVKTKIKGKYLKK